MITTEKEASSKLCANDTASMCCVSACMAWRFCKDQPTRKTIPAVGVYEAGQMKPAANWIFISEDDSGGECPAWLEPYDEYISRRIGYCGLAGKP